MTKPVALLSALLLALVAGTAAHAQPPTPSPPYPSKPVRILVPQAPGGATDLITRAVGARLTAMWGQQVVVENKPGANNIVAADLVARADPDGYTLFASPEATFVVNPYVYRKLPYNAEKDFVHISGLGIVHQVLVVHPSVPAKNVRELIALAKAKPGEVSVGTLALGGAAHLNVELFQSMADVKLNVVHYRGGAPALKDVIAGHVNMTILSVALTAPAWQSGKVRALGIGTQKRNPGFPEVPTVAESGLPGYEAAAWFGLAAPAATPREVVVKINADVQKVLTDPEFKAKFLAPNHIVPILGSPDQYAAFVKAGAAKWTRLIKERNIEVK